MEVEGRSLWKVEVEGCSLRLRVVEVKGCSLRLKGWVLRGVV